MKKIFILLISLLLLASCSNSNSYSYLSDGDEVIFSGNDKNYTKSDLYKTLKLSGDSILETDIINKISETYDIDVEQIEKDAEDYLNSYLEIGYESLIISYYGSLQAFKQEFISSQILNKLAEIYVEENFDELVNEDNPTKMQVVFFSELEDAEKFVEDVNNGSSFNEAAVNAGYETAPLENVYSDTDSSLVLEVKDYLNSTDNVGLSTIISSKTSSKDENNEDIETLTYYVLNIISRDVQDFKEDYISQKAVQESAQDVKDYFVKKHNIKFYDQDLYEIMSEKYEVLK